MEPSSSPGVSIPVTVTDAARVDLVRAIAELPDEAYGYVVAAVLEIERRYAHNGGFQSESRTGFLAMGEAARAWRLQQQAIDRRA